MSRIISLAAHFTPDSITRLERAADMRYADGQRLLPGHRYLAALYFFGYSVEMCLAAAYFRSAGFHPNAPIDRDTRHRRMVQARQLQTATGQPLMNADPHPLVGWARFLEWQRSAWEKIEMPQAERLPIVGPRCGALRIRDGEHNWRIMYRVDSDMVLILEVYAKKTRQIPKEVIDRCKKRLKDYDDIAKVAVKDSRKKGKG